MQPTIHELADRYWDLMLEANPLSATLLGDHRFDDRLPPLTDEEIEPVLESARRLKSEVSAVDPTQLDHDDLLTRELLTEEIDRMLVLHETGFFRAPIDAFIGIPGILQQVAAQTQVQPDNAEAILDRYARIPEYLEKAAKRHRLDAAHGRTPTATNLEKVLGQIDAYLASPPERDPFASTAPPEGWEGAPAWSDRLRSVVRNQVRPGFSRYREQLAGEILPHARSDEQPGLIHVPGGEEAYRLLVRYFTSLELDPSEIHQIGTEEATEQLPTEHGALGRQAFGLSDPHEVFAKLRNDPSLRYANPEEMLADARTAVERAWQVSEDWFGQRPQAPCSVVEVPAELAPSQPPAFYLPPPDDGSRPGIFFVNTHAPETRTRYDAEATAFHEAIPGHHFQASLAAELEEIPRFRRRSMQGAYLEGWGLYAERLADEMRLYSTAVDRLGMLSNESWRACRLVVDTGIHQLGWTRQQAIDFMMEWTASTLETVTKEVDRYIGIPGQALSYKVGQREIRRLRGWAEQRLGSSFDLRRFHDMVLTQGPLPLPVLAREIERWVGSVKTG